MNTRYCRGEVSLAYLFKLGFGAFLTMVINSTFDFVSGIVHTSKIQVIASSSQVSAVKSCIHESYMSGHFSGLSSCAGSANFLRSNTSLRVSDEGSIYFSEVIEGDKVTVELRPVFGDYEANWDCYGDKAKHLPANCRVAD